MEPEKLGPFRIGRVLGRGGMGTVYEGTCETDESVVAVKVLTDSLEDGVENRHRFESEIEMLKRLHHPNIVQISGFGEEQGRLYYVMELVDGSSLQSELKKNAAFNGTRRQKSDSTCARHFGMLMIEE
jgi:serine/threonine-protein kinase